MAETVGVFDGKARFSELIDRAERGEEIIVTKHGKPRFRLVSAEVRSARRPPGGGPMQISYLADDFDAPDPEIERLFGTRD